MKADIRRALNVSWAITKVNTSLWIKVFKFRMTKVLQIVINVRFFLWEGCALQNGWIFWKVSEGGRGMGALGVGVISLSKIYVSNFLYIKAIFDHETMSKRSNVNKSSDICSSLSPKINVGRGVKDRVKPFWKFICFEKHSIPSLTPSL